MRVLSGIQPTGQIHIGNYLGAIKQWLLLQEKNECFFFIADLHSLTIPYQPENLQKNILETAIVYLAAGINPEKSIFFVQSDIKEHTELCWLLNTVAPIGDLERMTQYKEKSRQFKKNINAGLLVYPVLQAADILLYKTEGVPVGKDQVQHIELARTIARKFNQRFGKTFVEPKAVLAKMGAKIMSLNNPKQKMSKSLESQSYISLFEEPGEIKRKVMSAVTDTGKQIKYNPGKKPGISNLLIIYSLFSEKPIKEVEKIFKGKGYAQFKKSLAELLINSLEPFRKKRKELLSREVYVRETLKLGAKRARAIAESTMHDVRQKIGLA
ncbi:MAG: tryptophan--tRNA ligase [Candidatus Nealsonbacteria bacterium CG10_big_fil_rev_8_21_14_0_10_36_24]|uniref:Tryptophan--tRNA ligase n=2 Tax=Candidatus Nealsoniibacteriota TaxID=1817911 RepID=A0A2H0YN12_9BACT|nr:MAG: tryptophan--tRNA ligase [Candidatus Nealsonbacteria bacterium CG10_big_fil_rev_8_21_14_0_10_36_24]PIS39878.1 MAG: tryptophan--tRNA ligase [Candidatus Nealsonbacteria bacterium CG08_land_8_20_14_0_20_36_22]